MNKRKYFVEKKINLPNDIKIKIMNLLGPYSSHIYSMSCKMSRDIFKKYATMNNMDEDFNINCTKCDSCRFCENCYDCFNSDNMINCSDSWESENCVNSSGCMGCNGCIDKYSCCSCKKCNSLFCICI